MFKLFLIILNVKQNLYKTHLKKNTYIEILLLYINECNYHINSILKIVPFIVFIEIQEFIDIRNPRIHQYKKII